MRRGKQASDGERALELIEQAVHLLRLAGARALSAYYLGAAPFALGLLYFWGDMSRSSSAEERCAPAALGVALLFLWMKTWQAIFVGQLKAQLTGRLASPLTWPRFFRVLRVQTALQPSGLLVLPMALLITLPFGWVYCFYQSVTASEEGGDVRRAFQDAKRQAQLWPRQNHLLLAILLLLGMVVFVNVTVGFFQIPSLLKTFFGIETAFTRGGWSFFNTTFLATACGLTYLCLDPLIKTIYLLRCFYGEALRSGEDLKAELKPVTRGGHAAAATVLVLGISILNATESVALPRDGGRERVQSTGPIEFIPTWPMVTPTPKPGYSSVGLRPGAIANPRGGLEPDRRSAPRLLAATEKASSGFPTSQPTGPRGQVSTPELDRSITEVINQREFNWRLPREKRAEGANERGVMASFVEGVLETIRGWGKTLLRWLKVAVDWLSDFIDWLKEKVFGKGKTGPPAQGSRTAWIIGLQILIFVLLALAACVVAVLFYRTWRRRRRRALTISEVVAQVPDLGDERVVASQLPADDWLKLARELMGKGELRLALRALYLASLAHLAQREMISVARFKSNRDYERELRRRARALPDLLSAFAENVGIFDRAWYGLHDVTEEAVQRFQSNLEKIMV